MLVRFRIVLYIFVCILVVVTRPGRLPANLGNISVISRIFPGSRLGVIEGFPTTHYVSGVVAFHKQNYESAIEHFGEISQDERGLAHWFFVQALNESGDWGRAIDSIDFDIAAESMLGANILFEHRDQMKLEERVDREEAVKRNPDAVLVYAKHLLSAKQYAEAEAWARLVPNFDNSISARLLVGRNHYYSGLLEEAEVIFYSLYLENQGIDVLYWYGITLVKIGKQEQGVQILEQAVEVATGDYVSRYLLADLSGYYATVGRCSDAEALLERGLQWNKSLGYISAVGSFQERNKSLCVP